MLTKETLRIENARLYPAELVDQLLAALSSGAELRPDDSRTNFYDVEANGRTFFIYISPVGGRITLIASWTKPLAASLSKSFGHFSLWRWIAVHAGIRAYT
jgi:hypothetical protein